MASYIKKGESILIPFRNGISIADSQFRPRIYKTVQAFEKSFPFYYLGNNGVELVEYVEVVRCKDCKHYVLQACACRHENFNGIISLDGYCSYGERKDNETD